MKTVYLHKAQAVTSRSAVESVTLVFDDEIPDTLTLKQYERLYDEQAEQLVALLTSVMAQGVLDRVLGKLMLRRASMFVVPMFAGAAYGGAGDGGAADGE